MLREPGSGPVLLLGGLGLLGALVFVALPRWTTTPVLTTSPPPSIPPAQPPPPEEASPPDAGTAVASREAEPVPRRRAEPPRTPPTDAPDDWSAAVSLGLAALERGAFAEALDAFNRAEAARPGTAAVADGIARARAGQLEQALREHRQKAEQAEGREDWQAALREYEAALGLGTAVSFAVEGRRRCAERAALDERLRRYLEKPERLSADAVAREAAAVLEQAEAARPAGPRLAAQRAQLEGLLAGMGQPVSVRLLSDGLTQVTILRVGPLGAFKDKTLELRPGSYVVVGARAGYRDVRRALVVPIGRSPAPLDVRCDEAL